MNPFHRIIKPHKKFRLFSKAQLYYKQRKALARKRLALNPHSQKNDRLSLLGCRRSFLLSIFILALCNFPRDIKSTE